MDIKNGKRSYYEMRANSLMITNHGQVDACAFGMSRNPKKNTNNSSIDDYFSKISMIIPPNGVQYALSS